MMKLEFIPLGNLAIGKPNMRRGRMPDVSGILPTVRKRRILQTLLVRPASEPGMIEIVAGRRRFHAAKIVAEERAADSTSASDPDPQFDQLPCGILDAGDDADPIDTLRLITAGLDELSARAVVPFVS